MMRGLPDPDVRETFLPPEEVVAVALAILEQETRAWNEARHLAEPRTPKPGPAPDPPT
jgi:hypothetical protein